jgi:hypothetical protein
MFLLHFLTSLVVVNVRKLQTVGVLHFLLPKYFHCDFHTDLFTAATFVFPHILLIARQTISKLV